MKKLLILATLLCLTVSAFAQFEGEIQMKIMAADGGGTMTMFISPNAIKTEMNLSAEMMKMQMASLMKMDNPNIIYIINDKSKSYSEIDLKEMEKMAQGMMPTKAKYQVQKLGKEKILGYDCDHILVSDTDSEMELWVTKDLLDYATFKKFNQSPQADGLEKAMKEAGVLGMPLKQIANKGTAQESKMEVVKINKAKLPPSTFEIPKGYKKTEGGLMGAGMDMMPDEAKAQLRESLKNMSPAEKKQMKESLKNMPPEQRNMMEQILNEK
jgi:hypothetical protein